MLVPRAFPWPAVDLSESRFEKQHGVKNQDSQVLLLEVSLPSSITFGLKIFLAAGCGWLEIQTPQIHSYEMMDLSLGVPQFPGARKGENNAD